ncbi:MAG: Gfo/Idh/MocA family oxidoreductase [Gammaproteobacteria bacterium]|nr:Gfo/Idh/MocA family oxidoreductase [Gammaproteobacteria bacterium]
MSKAAPIRLGIIGAGSNTRRRHIPGFVAQPNVELVAVANRSRESSARVAAEFDIPRACDDWLEIIHNDAIDAVCIGTWPYMHSEMTCAALAAGKHVLVEARMASNASQAQLMLEASRRQPSLVAQIVPAPHTLPFDQTIREMIADGFIGELIAVDARLAGGSAFPNREAPAHWRHDRGLSGNNVMAMGIWYEAITRWIGPTTSVQALCQVVVKHRRNEAGHRVATSIPDYIDVQSEVAQGGQLRLAMSSVIGHAPSADLYIYGSEGTLRLIGDANGDLALWAGARNDAALTEVVIPQAKRGGWRVEEEFVRAIRGEEEVTHTDFATGVHYMQWTDAVHESWKTGTRVPLSLK